MKENTSDVNSKNTKIDIHKKMADRLYNGLIIAEVEVKDMKESDVDESSKEDVEYNASVIVVDESSPSNESDHAILHGQCDPAWNKKEAIFGATFDRNSLERRSIKNNRKKQVRWK